MIKSNVYDCKIITLNKIKNRSGNITVIESNNNIPFYIRRIYYLFDIPAGEVRGGHAHKELLQLIIATSGSFNVIIDDGNNKRIIKLNRPDMGLLIVPGIWRELVDFSSGAITLVLASELYKESDYIRNYNDFKLIKHVN
jgi:dTDP-4-dehydrorhamnose 3,5-epimerase-like enzyme